MACFLNLCIQGVQTAYVFRLAAQINFALVPKQTPHQGSSA